MLLIQLARSVLRPCPTALTGCCVLIFKRAQRHINFSVRAFMSSVLSVASAYPCAIPAVTVVYSTKRRHRHSKFRSVWTWNELAALDAGVSRYGRDWHGIKKDEVYGAILRRRTPTAMAKRYAHARHSRTTNAARSVSVVPQQTKQQRPPSPSPVSSSPLPALTVPPPIRHLLSPRARIRLSLQSGRPSPPTPPPLPLYPYRLTGSGQSRADVVANEASAVESLCSFSERLYSTTYHFKC